MQNRKCKIMGVYSENLEREVRLERMRPEEVEAAKARRPAIYVPFGSIEWHGYHNPVGLDTLKAHEQLVGLAAEAGGVVYPPVYFGSGGGHTQWPSSFMVDPEPMVAVVTDLLNGFERDGYQKAILLSGHYPNRSEYMDRAIERYRESGGGMDVLVLVENQAPEVGGDHAAKFETSYMLHLHPETVSMDRLKTEPQTDIRGPDEIVNWIGEEYEGHPCYGLLGIDPRKHANAEVGEANTRALIRYLAEWLDGEQTGTTKDAKGAKGAKGGTAR